MKAVHFGAGNIGRGFIGPILSESDYEICFVARNEKKISQLQERGQYPVTLANETRDTELVKNVTAVNISDMDEVAESIAEADLVTTAIGMSALRDIAESIARGIELRFKKTKHPEPLHIIACENGIGGSQRLKKLVYPLLKPSERKRADEFVAFPNTMVDRIVPIQQHKDPLKVMVEPFCEWVIHKTGMLEGFTKIKGVRYVDSLDPYIERKLFTVNTGHCAAAYFGYLDGYSTIQEAIANPKVLEQVRGVLHETGAMLTLKHNLDSKKHEQYIEKMLHRFTNPHFIDKITRVARSPLRKLSPNDRLVRPALQAHKMGLETNHLVAAIAAALVFDHVKDPEAVKLQNSIREHGIGYVIEHHLGIPDTHPLHSRIADKYDESFSSYRSDAQPDLLSRT
ncbi:mannitol-1-phosphate 5-dehydrogenase [Paenibacillus sp. URB8-2]|uniref:mannitol-1-phosphate 5-dehydrogenase n=1 Tax=Paenibacillus sp. URB8-2 TaxID=2741301 RepID=UPI0015B99FAA|nr:mannitol-1-phosphate 5-dehydrogenase [Paenibacillus sp. URB8-2]BCG59138.1 mannitol-1-phosphate 5-dehydrogenase [Paenibacillus sp. URB8-2]